MVNSKVHVFSKHGFSQNLCFCELQQSWSSLNSKSSDATLDNCHSQKNSWFGHTHHMFYQNHILKWVINMKQGNKTTRFSKNFDVREVFNCTTDRGLLTYPRNFIIQSQTGNFNTRIKSSHKYESNDIVKCTLCYAMLCYVMLCYLFAVQVLEMGGLLRLVGSFLQSAGESLAAGRYCARRPSVANTVPLCFVRHVAGKSGIWVS